VSPSLTNDADEPLSGGRPDPHRHQVKLNQQNGGGRNDPQEPVAEVGPKHRVGRDPGRIIVGEAGQKTGPEHGEERHQCGPAGSLHIGKPERRAALVVRDGVWGGA